MDKKVSVSFLALFMITFMIYFTFQYPVRLGGFFVYEGQTYSDSCLNITPSSSSFSDNEVLYFKFNNNSNYGENDKVVCDLSGNSNNGFVSSGNWNASGGRYGDGAFDFTGHDKIFVFDDDSLSPKTTGEFTVSFWIKFNKIEFAGENAGYLHYMGKGGYFGNDYEYMFRQYNSSNSASRPNRISFYVFNKTGGWGVGSYAQDPITIGQWMHIVAVVNSTHTQFWKNGVMRDSDYYPDMIFPANERAPFNIGTVTERGYLSGSIDELRIYNKSLSSSQINALYNHIPEDDETVSNSTEEPLPEPEPINTSISIPTVSISSPQNLTYYFNQNILLSFSATDQESLSYRIDSSSSVAINSSKLFNTSYGQHTLYLTAINSEGNASDSVTFVIINTSNSSSSNSSSSDSSNESSETPSNESSGSPSPGTISVTPSSSSGGGGGGGGGGGSSSRVSRVNTTPNNSGTTGNSGSSGTGQVVKLPPIDLGEDNTTSNSSELAPRSRSLAGYAVKGTASNVLIKSSVFAFLCTAFGAISYILYLFIIKKDESILELMHNVSRYSSNIAGKTSHLTGVMKKRASNLIEELSERASDLKEKLSERYFNRY